MKQKISILSAALIILALPILIVLPFSLNIKTKVKELFKMNKTLQEEGYYMGDFEFKMVGLGYYLDKGQYKKALKSLNEYHKKLTDRKGLIKIPEFKDNQDEINFYLDLQNSETGAFIDGSAPFCTYFEVSNNIINHLEALKDSSTASWKLKYPVNFLDEINTPEKLTAFLEDVSYVGWPGSKFPQTSFHFARNILGEATSDNTFERNNIYKFSPEWKHTLLKWMYDFQDTTTGMWGPKNLRTNRLTKFDLSNTASILSAYRDKDGNDIYEEFPLKYKEKLFKSAIEQLSEPFPDNDDLDEIHEWNLRQTKGIKMLLRYLWKEASDESKKEAERIITRQIDICFEKYYIRNEGAFSYYPGAKHASGDGSTNLIFSAIGAYSTERQEKLWGDPAENVTDMGEVILNESEISDLNSAVNVPGINSLRIYNSAPDYKNLTDSVWAVFYPKDTLVPDIMELVPGMVRWAEASSLSMGNWTSMAEIRSELSKLDIEKPLIYKTMLPLEEVDRKFEKAEEFYIIGFDKLQVPRCRIKFKYAVH